MVITGVARPLTRVRITGPRPEHDPHAAGSPVAHDRERRSLAGPKPLGDHAHDVVCAADRQAVDGNQNVAAVRERDAVEVTLVRAAAQAGADGGTTATAGRAARMSRSRSGRDVVTGRKSAAAVARSYAQATHLYLPRSMARIVSAVTASSSGEGGDQPHGTPTACMSFSGAMMN